MGPCPSTRPEGFSSGAAREPGGARALSGASRSRSGSGPRTSGRAAPGDPKDSQVEAVVEVVEPLGNEILIDVKIGANPMVARVPRPHGSACTSGSGCRWTPSACTSSTRRPSSRSSSDGARTRCRLARLAAGGPRGSPPLSSCSRCSRSSRGRVRRIRRTPPDREDGLLDRDAGCPGSCRRRGRRTAIDAANAGRVGNRPLRPGPALLDLPEVRRTLLDLGREASA